MQMVFEWSHNNLSINCVNDYFCIHGEKIIPFINSFPTNALLVSTCFCDNKCLG